MVQLNKDLINKLNQKKYIDEYKNIDELLNALIDNYHLNNNIIIQNKELSSIRINNNTLERLKKLKYYPTESYNSVIFRLLYNL